MPQFSDTKIYGDLKVDGAVSSNQLMIFGSLTNTAAQAGNANNFKVYAANGLFFVTDRITVPQNGFYLITFQSINESNANRYDIHIIVNGNTVCSALNNLATGHHSKALSIVVQLKVGDYIQFYNDQWYNYTNTNYEVWRTASVTRLY